MATDFDPDSSTPSGWYPDAEFEGTLRYWDGSAWTNQRSDPIPPTESRSRRIAIIVGSFVVAGAATAGALAFFLAAQHGDAIARVKGTVVAVSPADGGQVDVCLKDVVDAGSTYGSTDARDVTCWSGEVEGAEPTLGTCVILQTEGEASYLRVELADGCR